MQKHLMHLKVIQQQMNMSKLGLNALGSIPQNVGALPPLSDTNFEHAITNSARALMAETGVDPHSNAEGSSSSSNSGAIVASSSTPRPSSLPNFNFGQSYSPSIQQPNEDDEGRINPLAGMGLTDEQYNLILQNIVSGDGFLDGMDNLVALSSSETPSVSGLGSGSGSGYSGGGYGGSNNGGGFLGSEVSTPTPAMGMYVGADGMMLGGEKRGLEEEGEGQREGKMKRGRYDVS
jgi:osomolarity two-component system, response regulator SKN7